MAKPGVPRPEDDPDFARTVALMVPFGFPSFNLSGGLVEGIKKGLHYKLTPQQIAEHEVALVRKNFGGRYEKAAVTEHGNVFRISKPKAAALMRGESIGEIGY